MRRILTNCRACTMQAHDYGLIDDAAIVIDAGHITWVGERARCGALQTPKVEHEIDDYELVDLHGALVTPGLIDCHTHLIYGGDRALEFEQRLNGVSYTEIAKAGGGILSTVRATREQSETQLFASAAKRLQNFIAEGVTTIEIKSGYGLDADNEIKMLRVARQLGEQMPVDVRTTFLGAHALPPEYASRSDDYIHYLCNEVLPAAHAQGLVDAVDVFCENIGFSLLQSMHMLSRAREMRLPIKIHAEQLSDLKGARMAAQLGALSVDHIEFLRDEDVPVLAQHGTVAVLLPGAFYYLRETKMPPVAALRAQRIPIAIASDHNPGTSPTHSLLLMLNMACTELRLTPLEALRGVTVNAARALGLHGDRGVIAAGMRADLAVFDVQHPAELSYRFGNNPCVARLHAGVMD